jgi:hypothetical protein
MPKLVKDQGLKEEAPLFGGGHEVYRHDLDKRPHCGMTIAKRRRHRSGGWVLAVKPSDGAQAETIVD